MVTTAVPDRLALDDWGAAMRAAAALDHDIADVPLAAAPPLSLRRLSDLRGVLRRAGLHGIDALLAACHGHLIYHAIPSLVAYRATPPHQLARLRPPYRAMIARLVRQADPDVIAALWPSGEVTWMVAHLDGQPTVRLLSAKRGPLGEAGGQLLSLSYDLADPDGERRAWRELKTVLMTAPPVGA